VGSNPTCNAQILHIHVIIRFIDTGVPKSGLFVLQTDLINIALQCISFFTNIGAYLKYKGKEYVQIITCVFDIFNISKWLCQFVFGIGRFASVVILCWFQRCYHQYYYGDIPWVYVVGLFYW
jgi:hypothetical protein